MQTNNEEMIRLHVYLSRAGVASRRTSEKLISDGRVSVNGIIVTNMGFKVKETDLVYLDEKQIALETKKRYIVLNKPAGYVVSMYDPEGRKLAYDLVKEAYPERLYNIGRLDYFSSGIIFFTNDGDFALKMSHPSSEIEKEYYVESSLSIPNDALMRFRRGLIIDGIRYKAKHVESLSDTKAKIVLIEGKNREIRKVLASFDVFPKILRRIRIGSIDLGTLKEGSYRDLTSQEIESLKLLVKKDT